MFYIYLDNSLSLDSKGSKGNLLKTAMQEIIENTLLQLFTVYFEVGRLAEEEKILKNALDISRRRYQRKLSQYEFGQTNNLEVLNAEVDVNTDSINLLNLS